jgi:hypothetical protein
MAAPHDKPIIIPAIAANNDTTIPTVLYCLICKATIFSPCFVQLSFNQY